jgi:hypothetical protein
VSDATDLLIWGIVVHLVIDWLGQNEWIAVNKAKRRIEGGNQALLRWLRNKPILIYNTHWWDRHPAAYVHAGMHGAAQLLVFPWPAALAIGITHFLIDTRIPVEWWSKLIRQTQPPAPHLRSALYEADDDTHAPTFKGGPVFEIGTDVRIWADQVWHIGVVALVALVVS